jgi:wobble nucleotide-excising tRNase
MSRVHEHLTSKLGRGGEEWARRGMSYLTHDSCPFCAQSTVDSEIVQAYRIYFSAAYNQHLISVQQALNEVEDVLGDQALNRVSTRALENEARIAAWSDLTSLADASFDTAGIEAAWRRVKELLTDRLKIRLAEPSAPLETGPELEAAIATYEGAIRALEAHNQRIAAANDLVSELKKKAASTNAAALEADLRRYRNVQIRHQPEVAVLCDSLTVARIGRREIEEQKAQTRRALEGEAASLLATFQHSINRLLRNFGASFQLTGTKPSFAAGKASSTYQLAINNVSIDLGDAKTPRGKPCFRTALSSGDKSTLALAFFMARLEADPDISTRIVIFDDPLSSLDCFRISCTQQEITKVAAKAQQVVVLSHDPLFLQGIHDRATSGTSRALQFSRSGSTHTLKEWDIKDHSLREAHHDYVVLRDFVDGSLSVDADILIVARAIRPYLEGHLRFRFPDSFASTDTLGEFVRRIQEADANSSLIAFKHRAQELLELNEFARRFHHTDSQGLPATTTPEELLAFANRALDLGRGA